jgi:hypothetical protein
MKEQHMHKSTHRSTTHASAAPTRARVDAAKRRSRKTIVGLLTALTNVAGGLGPAMSVDVPDGSDGEKTETAFVFNHSTWGATWS